MLDMSSAGDASVTLLLIAFLAAMVQYATPILFATLGEMVMERAGILNLGVEGMMMIGAFFAFLGMYTSGSPWLGFMLGCTASMLFCTLHGVVCMVFQGSQVVSGLALTILGVGLANFLGSPYIGQTTTGFTPFAIPILSDIPVIGAIFFKHDVLVYVSYFMPVLVWFVFMRTNFGLALRATGENPQAVRAAGLSPYKIRWASIFGGGFIVGMGGSYLSLSAMHIWSNDLSSGRGWIAVALVIFAFWKPGRAVAGAYLFGGIVALGFRLQALNLNVPTSLLDMLPYLLTLLVLLFAAVRGKSQAAPAALSVNLEPAD